MRDEVLTGILETPYHDGDLLGDVRQSLQIVVVLGDREYVDSRVACYAGLRETDYIASGDDGLPYRFGDDGDVPLEIPGIVTAAVQGQSDIP